MPLVRQVINCSLIEKFQVLTNIVVVIALNPNDDQNEVDQNAMNLLDLPRELLYKIFEYSRNVKSLVLVNRTLNELITQSSYFMELLTLKVEHKPNTRVNHSMNALVKSHPVYQHLKVVGKHNYRF